MQVKKYCRLRTLGAETKKDLLTEIEDSNSKEAVQTSSNGTRATTCRKRKVSSWQRGFLNNKKKRRKEQGIASETCIFKADAKLSEEETKYNIEDSYVTASTSEAVNRLHISEDSEEIVSSKVVVDGTMLLTVNCDTTSNSKIELNSPQQSPNGKRRLSDLLSPSELLEDTLDFDDVDQALKETILDEPEKQEVNVDVHKLDLILEQVVSISGKQPLQCLLDLHFQLSRIVNKYSRSHDRRDLPDDLQQELVRYSRKVAEKK